MKTFHTTYHELEHYNELKELVIETTFYLTQAVGDRNIERMEAYRKELNNLVGEIIKINSKVNDRN